MTAGRFIWYVISTVLAFVAGMVIGWEERAKSHEA